MAVGVSHLVVAGGPASSRDNGAPWGAVLGSVNLRAPVPVLGMGTEIPSRSRRAGRAAAAAAIPFRWVDNDRTVRGAPCAEPNGKKGLGSGVDDASSWPAVGWVRRWNGSMGWSNKGGPAGQKTAAARAVSDEACKLSAGTGMCSCSLEIRKAWPRARTSRCSRTDPARALCTAVPAPIFVDHAGLSSLITFKKR